MSKKYRLEHVGYPVAGRRIRGDEWGLLSLHTTPSAAWKAIKKHTSHLQPGSWDDHYRVIKPDGSEYPISDLQYDVEMTWSFGRKNQ